MSSKRGSVSLGMDSLKIFSRELTNQVSATILQGAKDFVSSAPKVPTKPVPSTATAAVASSSLAEDVVQLVRKLNQFILDGYVLTQISKSDSLYLLFSEIEEFIIIYSTYYSNRVNSVIDIKDLCMHLITVTTNVCGIDITSSTPPNVYIYSSSIVGQIRLCLRLLASKDPLKFIVIIEQILSKFLTQEEFQMFKKLKSCLVITNFTPLILQDVTTVYFFPQMDDPFSCVLHFHKFSQLSVNTSGSTIRSSKAEEVGFGFQVIRSGSQQIHGVYTAALNNTDTHLVYVNTNGYIITRIQHTLVMEDGTKCVYYVWYLANPMLHSTYYHCCTTNESVYPPSEGWLCYNSCALHGVAGGSSGGGANRLVGNQCCGILPPPSIQIVAVTKGAERAPTAATTAGVSQLCPLPVDSFSEAEYGVMNEEGVRVPPLSISSDGSLNKRLKNARGKRVLPRRLPKVMQEEYECEFDTEPYMTPSNAVTSLPVSVKSVKSLSASDEIGLSLDEEAITGALARYDEYPVARPVSCDSIADFWAKMQTTIRQTKSVIERKKEWLADCPADHLLSGRPQGEGGESLPVDLSTLDQVFTSFEPTGGDDTDAYIAEKDAYLEQNWSIDVLAEKYTVEAHAARLSQPSLQASQHSQANSSTNSIFGMNMAPLSNILSPVKIKEEATQLIGFFKDGMSKVLAPPSTTPPPPGPGEDYKLTSRRSANMITLIDNMELSDGKKKRVGGNQSALTDFLYDNSGGSTGARRKKDPNNPFQQRDRTSSANSVSPRPNNVPPANQLKSNTDLEQLGVDVGTPYVFGGGKASHATAKSADSLSTVSAATGGAAVSTKSNTSTATAGSTTSNKPGSIFSTLPTYDNSSPPSSMLKFNPATSPEPYSAGMRRGDPKTPPPSQHKVQLNRGRQELMREDDSSLQSQQLQPQSPQPTAEQLQYQKQIQHLNKLEESQRIEDATFALSDLCEMTLPERYHNDFKTKISVLGVEMWKSGRKTAAVERLNYVLRIWLSDIRHSASTSYGTTAQAAAAVVAPPQSPQLPQRGESASGESRGVVTLGAFTDRDDSENTLHTSRNNSGVSLLAGGGGGLSNTSMGNALDNSFKAVSKSSMLDLEFSESAQDEYATGAASPGKDRPNSTSQASLSALKVPANGVVGAVSASAETPVFQAKPLTPFSVFSRTMVERSVASVADESWTVFTIRRDLPSLGALHAELTTLLHGSDIEVPIFPDPFHIGTTEDDLIKNLFNSPAERKKLRYGTTPFLYNKNMRDPFDTSSGSAFGPGGLNNIDNVMSSVEQYLEGVFQIVAFIDELASEESSASQPASPSGVTNDDRFVYPGMEETPEVRERKRILDLAKRLGKLIGNFLHSSADNINDMLDSGANQGPSAAAQLRNGPLEEDDADLQLLARTSAAAAAGDSNVFLPPMSKRPCWYPYANNGLKLRANFNSHKALKSDADLLRIQRSRCLGCSLPLISNMFGFDCNYLSCRYYGGLFCRRWCHNGELRAVPVRLLQYWDNKSYKVCNQAVYFIDHISNKPLLNISTINPLLFEGVPLLRQIYRIRLQIAKLVETLIILDTNQVKQCIMNTVGKTKAHLCIANEIFSLHDVLNIHSGLLLINLQNLYNGLLAIKKNTKVKKELK